MEPTEIIEPIHVCGSCNNPFATQADYIAHMCPATNTTPADPQHAMGEDFAAIQAAALARGEARSEEATGEVMPETVSIDPEAIPV